MIYKELGDVISCVLEALLLGSLMGVFATGLLFAINSAEAIILLPKKQETDIAENNVSTIQ